MFLIPPTNVRTFDRMIKNATHSRATKTTAVRETIWRSILKQMIIPLPRSRKMRRIVTFVLPRDTVAAQDLVKSSCGGFATCVVWGIVQNHVGLTRTVTLLS